MEIKTICTIWIAEDHDTGELITATHKFEDLIDILCERHYIYDDFEVLDKNNNYVPIQNVLGNNWKDVLKRMSALAIDRMFEWEVSLRQLDLEMVVR